MFENTPLGLAVLENHRVGAVVKHAQGDYAGVQVGDTILEVDQRRVGREIFFRHFFDIFSTFFRHFSA